MTGTAYCDEGHPGRPWGEECGPCADARAAREHHEELVRAHEHQEVIRAREQLADLYRRYVTHEQDCEAYTVNLHLYQIDGGPSGSWWEVTDGDELRDWGTLPTAQEVCERFGGRLGWVYPVEAFYAATVAGDDETKGILCYIRRPEEVLSEPSCVLCGEPLYGRIRVHHHNDPETGVVA